MRDYEIRYMHSDGSLSLLYKTACQDDANAHRVARQMQPGDCARYEVWSDNVRVDAEADRHKVA